MRKRMARISPWRGADKKFHLHRPRFSSRQCLCDGRRPMVMRAMLKRSRRNCRRGIVVTSVTLSAEIPEAP